MNIDVKQDQTEAAITVKADEKALEPIVRQVFNQLRQDVKAEGFRPGRAPNEIVEQKLGAERVQAEVVEAAATQAFRDAVKGHDIRPLGQPHVELKKFVPYTDMELTMKLEVVPPVKLADYKKYKLKSKAIEVTDEEVDKVIEGLRIRAAKREEVKRAAKKDDEVIIDFKGTDEDGAEVPGASAQDYPAVIGAERLLPEFEKQLVGLKAGDEKKFKVTFPKDYQAEALRGQEVEFEVKVQKVNEVKLPAVDDKLASEVGPFESIKELCEDVKRQVKAEKEQQLEREAEDEVVQHIIDNSKLNLPPQIVEKQLQHLKSHLDEQLSSRGITREQYLKSEGKEEKDLNEELEQEAQRRVKSALILSEVAKQEKLEVTPEELEVRMQMLAGQYQDEKIKEELAKPEVKRDIANQLLTEKTIAKLVEYSRK